jgi:GR25 family glycosyltransferase involved in LPS biosynthesis
VKNILKKSISFQWKTEVNSAYVITIKGNKISETLSARCLSSCKDVDMPCKIWDAFDGTSGEILIPAQMENKDWLKWIKVVNPALVVAEICAMLSHISLWAHCVEIDQPIVILEHDSVFLKKFVHHYATNAIIYLGCQEQNQDGNKWCPIPPMWALGPNFYFINRAHAYSVDPVVARRLLCDVMLSGIHAAADVFIRSDIYTQIQMGLYASDIPHNVTTCSGRDIRNNDVGRQKINHKLIY